MNELVFWHGWGIASDSWHTLTEHLPGDCRFRLQSLPGYDGTPAPRPYTAETLVDALLADLPAPVTLCGWSMGSMLALLAAHRHPDKIERLILIGATPSFLQRPDWSHGMAQVALAAFSEAIRHDAMAVLQRFIALFNQNDANSRSIVRLLATTDLPSIDVLEGGLTLLRDTDLRPLIPVISQPTLLLHGAHDPLMPLSAAKWLVRTMPEARLCVFPHAAHAPFLSDPVRCATLITDFLYA